MSQNDASEAARRARMGRRGKAAGERVSLVEVFGRTQRSPLPPPMAQEALLPLHRLDPEMFERVVVEVAWLAEHARRVDLYGRRGQKQYWLDVVGDDYQGQTFVYQARRLDRLTPQALRKAVIDYTGSRDRPGKDHRRFGASKFVLATSVPVNDDVALVDEARALREEYAGVLEVELYGAERLSRELQGAVAVVARIFGPHWARTFCGVEPPERQVQDPDAFALLEGPLAALGLEEADTRSRAIAVDQPLQAAAIDQEIATRLRDAGYAGHADLIRRRRAHTLMTEEAYDEAFEELWLMAWDTLQRGEWRFPAFIEHALDEGPLRDSLDALRLARLQALLQACTWHGRFLDLEQAAADAQTLASDQRAPHAAELTCLLLEQALTDQLITAPDQADAAPLIAAARAVDQTRLPRLWRARLACALADADLDARGTGLTPADVHTRYKPLLEAADLGAFGAHAAALVHARTGRALAHAGEAFAAISAYKHAIVHASRAGHYGDVRLYARAWTALAQRTDISAMPDLTNLVRALPDRRRLIGDEYAAISALESLRHDKQDKLANALEETRYCLWEHRVCGHLAEEWWARQLYAEVLEKSNFPYDALLQQISTGQSERAAQTAATMTEWFDPREALSSPVSWVVAAAASTCETQADLIPDIHLSEITDLLLAQLRGGLPNHLFAPQTARTALSALVKLGIRLPHHAAEPIITAARPAVLVASAVSELAMRALATVYLAVPEQRANLAGILIDSATNSTDTRLWGILRQLRNVHEPLVELARQCADAGNDNALLTMASWGEPSARLETAARRATQEVLAMPIGQPGDTFTMTTLYNDTAVLLTALLDQPESTAELGTAITQHQQPCALLADRVGNHTLAIALERRVPAFLRIEAITLLRSLLRYLPSSTCGAAAEKLLGFYDKPSLSEFDEFELSTLQPLSRVRLDTGARRLAAHSLAAAGDAAAISGDAALRDSCQQRARAALRDMEAETRRAGALVLAALAPLTAWDCQLLAEHPDTEVRAVFPATWSADPTVSADILDRLVKDKDATVRAAVALNLRHLPQGIAAMAHQSLAGDRSFRVRHNLTAK